MSSIGLNTHTQSDSSELVNKPETHVFRRTRQSGLTLIEIMIALLIGAFLSAGVIQIFLSAKQSYRVQEELSRLQENGRVAMNYIGRDIRMADYRLCPTRASQPSAIEGTEGTASASSEAPDSINLRWFAANCNGSITLPLLTDMQGVFYEVKPVSKSLERANTPFVEGVENMQIVYGVDTDANKAPNYYAPAGVADMARVTTIRVSLLLATLEDNVASQPLTYVFNGKTYNPVDRRIRRVFTSTFAVRSRLP